MNCKGKNDPQAGLRTQNSKSDPGMSKTNEELFRAGMYNGQYFCYKSDSGCHLACVCDTRRDFTSCYNLYNTLTALEEKNKVSVETEALFTRYRSHTYRIPFHIRLGLCLYGSV